MGQTTLAGLTGGIGSGKSTVAEELRRRGAAVADADVVAREIVEPGWPAHADLVARFGEAILQVDGAIDRAALASVAFGDDEARAALNAITHPRIGERMAAIVADSVTAGAPVVVLDVPLLVPKLVASYGLQAVIVVDTPTDVAVARLVEHRGFTEADARARVASQISREERRGLVELVEHGWVVDNSGARNALDLQIDRVWEGIAAIG